MCACCRRLPALASTSAERPPAVGGGDIAPHACMGGAPPLGAPEGMLATATATECGGGGCSPCCFLERLRDLATHTATATATTTAPTQTTTAVVPVLDLSTPVADAAVESSLRCGDNDAARGLAVSDSDGDSVGESDSEGGGDRNADSDGCEPSLSDGESDGVGVSCIVAAVLVVSGTGDGDHDMLSSMLGVDDCVGTTYDGRYSRDGVGDSVTARPSLETMVGRTLSTI